MNVADLSCIFIHEKTLKECCNNLIEKIKKNGYNYSLLKSNRIKCSKGGNFCEIEIIRLNSNKVQNSSNSIDKRKNVKEKKHKDKIKERDKNNPPLYNFKIYNKRGGLAANKVFLKLLTN